jgi:hypothetical protein
MPETNNLIRQGYEVIVVFPPPALRPGLTPGSADCGVSRGKLIKNNREYGKKFLISIRIVHQTAPVYLNSAGVCFEFNYKP